MKMRTGEMGRGGDLKLSIDDDRTPCSSAAVVIEVGDVVSSLALLHCHLLPPSLCYLLHPGR